MTSTALTITVYSQRMRHFYKQIKRRNTYRAALLYGQINKLQFMLDFHP